MHSVVKEPQPLVLYYVDQGQVAELAEQLGEVNPPAIGQIRRLIRRLGPDMVSEVADAAVLLDHAGGLLRRDGGRRTLGGIFFFLMAHHPIGQKVVQPYYAFLIPPEPVTEPFVWSERLSFQVDPKGEVGNVKITVTGRPGHVTQANGFVSTVLSQKKVPSLPKGLPSPPPEPTEYMVFITNKHWGKVAAALDADPTDQVIVEGWCSLDAEAERIAVFALNTTTRGLQRKQREAQSAQHGASTPAAGDGAGAER